MSEREEPRTELPERVPRRDPAWDDVEAEITEDAEVAELELHGPERGLKLRLPGAGPAALSLVTVAAFGLTAFCVWAEAPPYAYGAAPAGLLFAFTRWPTDEREPNKGPPTKAEPNHHPPSP